MSDLLRIVDQQDALGFLVSQTASIESKVYQRKYSEIQYRQLVDVSTDASEWARNITFFSQDQTGQPAWANHMARDMPLADFHHQKHDRSIHLAWLGYHYTLEELGQAMMIPGLTLTADRAMSVRTAYEKFLDQVFFEGMADAGHVGDFPGGSAWTGLLNDPNVTSAAAKIGALNSSTWATKTPDEIIFDVNAALSGVHVETVGVELANHILMPLAAWDQIASMRLTNRGDTTVLDFIRSKNSYTARTGVPLVIRGVPQLDSAAAGTRRMVAYRRDPEVMKFHLPMPLRFLPVWQTGPILFEVPGIFRTGGLEIRLPKAVRYITGIA